MYDTYIIVFYIYQELPNMAQEALQKSKMERFKRLAEYRTNEVLKKLRVLGNCSNRSAYEYTEGDINKIFSEIERKMKETKAKFHFPKNRLEFKL